MGSFGAESPLIAGRYRLHARLGRGGMGTVWRATDELLHRQVAVKEIHVGEDLPESDARSQRERTLREARTIAQFKHPSLIVVHDVVEQDDRPWIVMELVDGQSLAERLAAEGPVSPREAARIGLALLGALQVAHRHGVLHRDLKPANVLLERAVGRVVLTDFGIAHVEGGTTITERDTFVGSPEYTAPERMSGTGTGPASDLWSLGVLLCAALSGRTPFQRDSLGGVLHAVVADEIRPPDAAAPLLPVIRGLLERDPAHRLPAPAAEALLRVFLRTNRMPQLPNAYAPQDRVPAEFRPPEETPLPGAAPGGPGATGPVPEDRLPLRFRGRRGRTALAAALMVAAAGGAGVAAVAMLVNGDGTPLDDRPSTSRPDDTAGPDDDGPGEHPEPGTSRTSRPTATLTSPDPVTTPPASPTSASAGSSASSASPTSASPTATSPVPAGPGPASPGSASPAAASRSASGAGADTGDPGGTKRATAAGPGGTARPATRVRPSTEAPPAPSARPAASRPAAAPRPAARTVSRPVPQVPPPAAPQAAPRTTPQPAPQATPQAVPQAAPRTFAPEVYRLAASHPPGAAARAADPGRPAEQHRVQQAVEQPGEQPEQHRAKQPEQHRAKQPAQHRVEQPEQHPAQHPADTATAAGAHREHPRADW